MKDVTIPADILNDNQLAEDAVQEAFVRVAKHMENIGQPEETATKRYLITIAKHAAIDIYRKRNRLRNDVPDGYYIYNEDVKTKNVILTGQTEYSFLDWTREFGGTDVDIRVTTRDKEIFQKYLETYTDAKPGMPFFLKVKGKKVIGIWEKPMA